MKCRYGPKKYRLFLLLLGISLVSAQTVQAAEKVVNIGAVVGLSGSSAAYGLDYSRAITLAASEINAQGGITVNGEKYQFKIISYDNEMKPAVAVKMAMRLRTLDHCPVIFAAESLTGLSVMKYNEKEKFLFVGVVVAPEFTQSGNKLVVRITSPFTNFVHMMIEEAWRQGIRKAGVMVISFETSKRWATYFDKKWKERGGRWSPRRRSGWMTWIITAN